MKGHVWCDRVMRIEIEWFWLLASPALRSCSTQEWLAPNGFPRVLAVAIKGSAQFPSMAQSMIHFANLW
jgi:hypothetical protein